MKRLFFFCRYEVGLRWREEGGRGGVSGSKTPTVPIFRANRDYEEESRTETKQTRRSQSVDALLVLFPPPLVEKRKEI